MYEDDITRNEYIRLMRSIGWTLQKIADQCNLSKERVRQICKKASCKKYCQYCGKLLLGNHRKWCNKECGFNNRVKVINQKRQVANKLYIEGQPLEQIGKTIDMNASYLPSFIGKWDTRKHAYIMPDGKEIR